MKQSVISTKSWKSLIESLKANSKHGYNRLESLKQVDRYFTAVLCQNTDASYLERLKIVTGEEEVGIKGLIDFLNHSFVPSDFVVKEEVVQEPLPLQTESIIKIKRVPRKPKESK